MNRWVTKNGTQIIQLLSGRSNVFLIKKDEACVLVDTSVSRRYEDLKRKLGEYCPEKENLKALVLTHGHFDHVANAAELLKIYPAKIIAHEQEATFLEKGHYPIPKGTIFPTKTLLRVFKGATKRMGGFAPIHCDIKVKDRYELKELVDLEGYLLHTPGHTVGCISVIVDNEIAIVGDAMFGVYRSSIFPPFADAEVELIKSWKKLLDTGCEWFLPSHGSANTRELVISEYEKYRLKEESVDGN